MKGEHEAQFLAEMKKKRLLYLFPITEYVDRTEHLSVFRPFSIVRYYWLDQEKAMTFPPR